MNRSTALLVFALAFASAAAQVEHRVHLFGGAVVTDPVNALDSITFDLGVTPELRLHRTDLTVLPIALTDVDSVDFGPMATWTFVDPRDSNVYAAVTIGDQCWMAENLRYLPSVVNAAVGGTSTPWQYVHGYTGMDTALAMATPAYTTYGVLYNWAAAMQGASGSSTIPSGVQGICPDGWHLPSDDEVKQMEMHLGLTVAQANALNYRGTDQGSRLAGNAALWEDGDLEANAFFGSAGFNGLPGSVRSLGSFNNTLGEQFAWWTATDHGMDEAWYRGLHYSLTGILRNNIEREYGLSVRCVCDQ